MTPVEPTESPALSALTSLLRASARRPSAVELETGLAEVRARLSRARPRPGRVRRSLVAIAAASALALAGFALFHSRGVVGAPAPVSVSAVHGGRLLEGGYLSAPGGSGVVLVFNEGSKFVLEPGARGRVRAVTTEGARLTVEQGTGSFSITPSREHRWAVEAGPFVVNVRGTDFSVTWDPQRERFELRLRHGAVTVSGPVLGEDWVLRAGQNLTVDLRKAETVITEGRPADAPAELAAPAPEPAVVEDTPPASAAPPPASAGAAPSSAPSGERRWREALASGDWDRVLSEVERDGVDAALQTASSGDLLALADAARYRRRADLARAALLAHRRRFPGSADTSFLLGRVEELRPGGSSEAMRWYEEYLARSPSGTYAAEALGRKMILTEQARGPSAARSVAEEYLRRFPEGSYAGAARALLSAR